MNQYLPLLVAGPFAAAALVTALHRIAGRGVIDLVTGATCLLTVFGTAALLSETASGPVVVWLGGWEPRAGTAIGITLAADRLGAGFALLIGMLMTAVVLFSRLYFARSEGLFQALLLVFLGAAVGFCISGDLFNLYVFFELIGVTTFVLTAYRMEDDSLQGAFAFAIVNTLAGILVLIGIGVLYAHAGAVNLAELGRLLAETGDSAPVRLAFVLILTGLLVKAAAVPFQLWLPDAYAGAAAPVCVLFAGASVTLGVFGAARLYWTVFEGAVPAASLAAILLPMGAVTALYGAFAALIEHNLKRLLALTTVSHVGVLLMALALARQEALEGGASYLVGHAFIKAALFVSTGAMIARAGSAEAIVLEKPGRVSGASVILFALGGLLLAGLPPSGAQAGKALIGHAAQASGVGWIEPVSMAAAAGSGAAILVAAVRMFGAKDRDGARGPHSGAARTGAMDILALALLALGAASALPRVTAGIALGARAFVDRESYAAAVLENVPPKLAAPADHHAIGIGASDLLAPALATALAAFVILGARLAIVDAVLRLGRRGIAGVYRLHAKHVGDYVAWTMMGLCLVGIVTAMA